MGLISNKTADKIAKNASTIPFQSTLTLYRDFRSFLINKIIRKWNDYWKVHTSWKIFTVRSNIYENVLSAQLNRRNQTVLTRLRIGYWWPLIWYSKNKCNEFNMNITSNHVLRDCLPLNLTRRSSRGQKRFNSNSFIHQRYTCYIYLRNYIKIINSTMFQNN